MRVCVGAEGDARILGNHERMLPLWPTMSGSPVLKGWDWSPLIHAAYERNRELFSPPAGYSRLAALGDAIGLSSTEDPRSTIKGLLAVHIRRGDFAEHCRHLARWGADWNSWNSFPEFVDRFEKPEGTSADEVESVYMRRCYPSIEQIVDKVRRVQEGSRELRYLYVMTNGAVAWVKELEEALREDGRVRGRVWASVKSSRDLELTWQEKFVGHAVDMYVAQRAEVLIGNGVSAVSVSVLLCVLADGITVVESDVERGDVAVGGRTGDGFDTVLVSGRLGRGRVGRSGVRSYRPGRLVLSFTNITKPVTRARAKTVLSAVQQSSLAGHIRLQSLQLLSSP